MLTTYEAMKESDGERRHHIAAHQLWYFMEAPGWKVENAREILE